MAHRNRWLALVYLLKTVIFYSYLSHYQRVTSFSHIEKKNGGGPGVWQLELEASTHQGTPGDHKGSESLREATKLTGQWNL